VEITSLEPVGAYAIQPTFSDGHSTGIYSWDVLYDYGLHQEEMWRHYLQRLNEAGASRDPGPAPFEQRPKSK
ncbi:MAG: gamma-butyrobetaine hydroxylase-like domain-containing protein, partial [Burkholderiales bacterium]